MQTLLLMKPKMKLTKSLFHATFLFVSILNVSSYTIRADETVTVSVTQGQLRGRVTTTYNGVTYYSFQGIPYAKPPVGALRYKGPQPPTPWEGIRDALSEESICVQRDQSNKTIIIGNEDCLFVNVYTTEIPSVPSQNLKPVMVWIHGGAFEMGSGNILLMEPDNLLQEGVIVVTLNYRLGVLGFLSTGDSVIPGNNGLKDQVMALRWVKQNIAQFGGDPNKVTIFGESAGGGSVHYQLLTPMTEGLFQYAIAQSGSALDSWAYESPSSARNRTLKLCRTSGLETNNSTEILEFLLSLTAEDIMNNVWNGQTAEERRFLNFRPTSEENKDQEEEIFISEKPINIIQNGNFHKLPFISGTVSQEGMVILLDILPDQTVLDYYIEHFEAILPDDLNIDKNSAEAKELANKVKQYYFGEKELSMSTLIQFVNANTDILFLNGVDRHIKLQASLSSSPVYQYELSFNGRWGIAKSIIGDIFPGVSHADDLGYIFYDPNIPRIKEIPELMVSERILKMWTNFAKTGDPTPEEDPLLQNITWSPATQENHFYLEIGRDLSIKRNLRSDQMEFWNDIYNSMNS